MLDHPSPLTHRELAVLGQGGSVSALGVGTWTQVAVGNSWRSAPSRVDARRRRARALRGP